MKKIKIDKILNKLPAYNQVVFALIGTFFLLGGGLFFLLMLIDLISFSTSNNQILSNAKAEEIVKENKKQQILSIEQPLLIDSINNYYVIPISQKLLKKEDSREKTRFSGLSDFSSSYVSSSSSGFYGPYINLLFFDVKSGDKTQIFDHRVNIHYIKVYEIDSTIYLFLFSATEDTDNDGFLTSDDLSDLYIFSTNNKDLKKIHLNNIDIINAGVLNKTNQIIIEIGYDINKNGSYDYDDENTSLKLYDYKTQKLIDFVDNKMLDKLKDIINGKVM